MKKPDCDSGYASGAASDDIVPEIVLTQKHLQFLNRQLQFLEPKGELSCCDRCNFPSTPPPNPPPSPNPSSFVGWDSVCPNVGRSH